MAIDIWIHLNTKCIVLATITTSKKKNKIKKINISNDNLIQFWHACQVEWIVGLRYSNVWTEEIKAIIFYHPNEFPYDFPYNSFRNWILFKMKMAVITNNGTYFLEIVQNHCLMFEYQASNFTNWMGKMRFSTIWKEPNQFHRMKLEKFNGIECLQRLVPFTFIIKFIWS